jgi:hopanoid biosynthesis associated radical SAM protein HpnJ
MEPIRVMKTLFLNPPSFEGFDGGAGSRYQARREIQSFWYPTWLAQPAAMVPGSRLVDAPARKMSLEDVLPLARDFELVVMHTSTPSFPSDAKVAAALKAVHPGLMVGFVGPHVMVSPESALLASPAIDFVAGLEFEYAVKEVADGVPLESIDGISFKAGGKVVRNRPREPVEDMDSLPHVVDVYRRDLVIEDYFIGYLLHPYVSLYTGRGCRSRCTFCLWPQTIGGHRYRTRSPENVAAEVEKIKRYFPQTKEVFFDDDTFTDDLPRAEAIARLLGKLGVTWSCSAKANVPFETLRVMRENGLRLLLVGYESGCQEILNAVQKGTRVDIVRRFTADCKQLGIAIHGTFIVGLPGETRETIERTIRFATEIDPHTIQVSLAAAYPGTELYRQARENGWLVDDGARLVGEDGVQVSSLSYPHLSKEEIFRAVETFYRRFYFRPGKILEFVSEMARSRQVLRRRLREGAEFLRFLSTRTRGA